MLTPLIILHDTDTGCHIGYIHTSEEVPSWKEIGEIFGLEMFEVPQEQTTVGSITMAVVKYESNGWGIEPLPQVGCVTIYTCHARDEEVCTQFLIHG